MPSPQRLSVTPANNTTVRMLPIRQPKADVATMVAPLGVPKAGNAAGPGENKDDLDITDGRTTSLSAPFAIAQATKRIRNEDCSSSEAEVSDWAAEDTARSDGAPSVSNHSNSSSSAPAKGDSKKASPCTGAKSTGTAAKKTLAKRDASKATASPSSPAKRVKTSTAAPATAPKKFRGNPSFTSGPGLTVTGSGSAGDGFMNFNSTVYEIKLGETDFKYHGHESVLAKSPVLLQEIEKAKKNPRRARQQTLHLDPHDPGAFEQLLQYLYRDQFVSLNLSSVLGTLKEFHELMSLAKHFQLPGLQKLVVQTFQKSKLLTKVDALTFFDWGEDMYYEELDHEKGPFKKYFERVAPTMIKEAMVKGGSRGLDKGLMTKLLEMVKLGGGYAEELFKAVVIAMGMRSMTVVKNEPGTSSPAHLGVTGNAAAAWQEDVKMQDHEEGGEGGLFRAS
ncbi:MAG: hypothetical protein Q9163_004139 [Psora crenata]